jgi:GT2 family glycosyltransferase
MHRHEDSSAATQRPGSLAVVVLNYQTAAYTITCLKTLAIEKSTVPDLEVIVVDNASADGSPVAIAEYIRCNGHSTWMTLVSASSNLGFAAGNNLAIAQLITRDVPPAHILLLNSDTEVHCGCLRSCLLYATNQQGLGAMSCLLVNSDGSVQSNARQFPRPLTEVARALGLPWQVPALRDYFELDYTDWNARTQTREVDWLGGAFLWIPTPVLLDCGGLDEDFFFYGEDIEFSHRLKRRGYKVIHNPCGTVTHHGGGSSDSTRLQTRKRAQLVWRARLLAQRKCFGRTAETAVRCAYIFAMIYRKIKVFLKRRTGSIEDQRISQALLILAKPFQEEPV